MAANPALCRMCLRSVAQPRQGQDSRYRRGDAPAHAHRLRRAQVADALQTRESRALHRLVQDGIHGGLGARLRAVPCAFAAHTLLAGAGTAGFCWGVTNFDTMLFPFADGPRRSSSAFPQKALTESGRLTQSTAPSVVGATPLSKMNSEGFPSGQRGQTVNLLAKPSEVRILPPPPTLPNSRALQQLRGKRRSLPGGGFEPRGTAPWRLRATVERRIGFAGVVQR